MAQRIYLVRELVPDEAPADTKGAQRLVRASHPSIAMKHVARERFDVEVARQEDLVSLLNKGIKVEESNLMQDAEPTA